MMQRLPPVIVPPVEAVLNSENRVLPTKALMLVIVVSEVPSYDLGVPTMLQFASTGAILNGAGFLVDRRLVVVAADAAPLAP